jgi:hypothetical protein
MKNPITTIKNYAKNVDKELTDIFGNQQRTGSGEIAKKAKGTPQGKAAANKLRKDRSELFGAILQGRRYDAGVKTTTATVNKVFRPSSNK